MREALEISEKRDEELVLLSLKDKENYIYLMERYESKLLRYIFRITNCSREDAEDILQDVFIKAYRNLNDFDPTLKFSSWIYRICHNEVISHWRKTSAQPKSVELFDNNKDFADSRPIYAELDSKLNHSKILEILGKMPIKYREVLVLRYFEEKDYDEMADILKVPPGTIGTWLNRAKKAFRSKTKELEISF